MALQEDITDRVSSHGQTLPGRWTTGKNRQKQKLAHLPRFSCKKKRALWYEPSANARWGLHPPESRAETTERMRGVGCSPDDLYVQIERARTLVEIGGEIDGEEFRLWLCNFLNGLLSNS